MNIPRYALLLLMLLLSWLPGHAQTTYPIQVNVHLLPPYSPYLSDYYSTTRERIAVTLINRDQLKPTVNVKLRMIISAPGSVRIQTNDNAFFQPVAVDNGMPVRLTQDDLAPYFQPNALITQGNLPSGRLPEGMVEFCFQAVEAYTGQILSASTCARAWIISQKPPLLSLPRNQESVAFREPLNLLFQWTPQHQGLSQVEYDFILKELWDNGMAPQAAFVYAPEVYRETTRSTSFAYGAMQPQLLPGKRYAWCVRAKVREGMDELNLFQNEGYSEVRWFTLQDNCMPPQYVEATAERRRLNLKWNALPEHTSFTIAYRPRSQDGVTQQEWKEVQTFDPQYRVGSLCQGGTPVYTPILTATIPAVDNARLAQCGILPEVNVANQEPLKALQTAEVFYAGDFPITVVTVSGSNGTFTGQGWTEIPWLNDVKVAVEFKNISINTDHRMINGFVEAKYDKQEGQVANVDDVFEGGFDQGLVKTGLTGIDYTLDFSIPGVEAFALNDAGDLIITDAEGTPHSLPITDKEGEGNEGNKVQVFPMTVKDKDGTLYQVEKVTETDAQGNTHEVAKATKLGTAGSPLPPGSFDPDQINERKAIVTFNAGKGRYAFDIWQPYYNKIKLIGDKYKQMGADYYASWKLLPAGASDQLAATIDVKDNTIDPTKVIFTTPLGTRYNATYDNGTYTLTITAGPAGDVQELYALYPKPDGKYYTFGKVGIATYTPQQHEVVLVTVDNVSIDEDRIRQVLADTYGPLGITWTVRRDAFDYQASGLMAEATGLSTYNEAMRSLNQAYRAARPDFSKSANYLFFMKATGNTDINNRDLTGFMPRGAQFGYIFTSEVQDQYEAITVAHELGHGRWKLYHPFDKHYGGYDEARLTDNLLAYGNGQHIAKWQWDQIADPALMVSVFEGDEKSAAFGSGKGICLGDLEAIKQLNQRFTHFYLPDGRVWDTEGKYLVSGFFPNTSEEPEGSRGSVFSLRVDAYDYLHLYTTKPANKTTGFGLKTSNGTVSSIGVDKLKILERSSDAVRIFVDQKNKELKVYRDGVQVGDAIKITEECTCRGSEPSMELYFAFDDDLDKYVKKAIELGKNVVENFHDNEELIDNILPAIEQQKGINSKNEVFLGEILADKLKTYEIFNGRKFFVAPIEVNTLATSQASWNQLAKVAFEKAGLGSQDILVTVPYVQCTGVGLDKGEYFFMPGLAFGDGLDIDIEQLNNGNYSNVQKVSSFVTGSISPVERFIIDVFKYTAKKMLLYKAVFNASNTIECIKIERDNVSGQSFNKYISLSYQKAVDELAQLIEKQKLAKKELSDIREKYLQQPYLRADQRMMAVAATDRRLAVMTVIHTEERLEFIRQHAEDKTLESYQASFYDMKIREEYLDADFEHERTKDLGLGSTFGLAYIFTDAYNELRQKLNYNNEDIGFSGWKSAWTFTGKVDYILQQYDQSIYNAIDGASIALGCFGLDFVADGVGLGYSLMRRDVERAGGYAVGVLIAGPEGVVVAKASASALILLFTKKGIKEVGEKAGKEIMLELAQKYADDGLIDRDLLASMANLEEKELAAALKSALKGQIDPSQLTNLGKLSPDALAVVSTWEPEIFLKLEDDLSQDAIFAEKFFEEVKSNPKLVEAWKALDEAGVSAVLRKDPSKLKAIKDYVERKGLNYSLINKELDNLPNHQEDLIKSFEIANGTATYPILKNKLPVSTEGEFYGTFVNG